jgi:hypothetical protein
MTMETLQMTHPEVPGAKMEIDFEDDLEFSIRSEDVLTLDDTREENIVKKITLVDYFVRWGLASVVEARFVASNGVVIELSPEKLYEENTDELLMLGLYLNRKRRQRLEGSATLEYGKRAVDLVTGQSSHDW